MKLACIVEGHGEVDAVPILVRRLAQTMQPGLAIQIEQPLRVPRNRLTKPRELERAVELAGRRVGPKGAVLLILDSDDECPASLAPVLLTRACNARPDLAIGVVLAKREFEAWFLAAADSLRGKRGLGPSLSAPEDPESIRGAKEWLTSHMAPGRRYVETLDQPALAATFDLELARRAPSFDKLYREVAALINHLS
ncbi:MAG: DUF4276 family protein [Thermoanaerobaculia bacterium]